MLIAALFASAAISGQATHFGVSASLPATADDPITITVTALDANESVDKSYKNAHNLSFTGPVASPNLTPPSYPGNPAPVVFDQGVASVQITLRNAAPTTLTVTEEGTGINGSGIFTVGPGAPADLEFTTQPPVWVQKDESFPADVTVRDAWGNLIPGKDVSIALNKHATELTCTPSCTDAADSSGVANFSLSVAKDTVGYELIATAEDATKNSNPFIVADQFGQFANGQGPSGQDDPGTTQVSTIVNGAAGNNLGITVDATIPIRLDLCGGGTQVGSGTVFEVVESTGDPQPTFTITGTVFKSALIDTSRGAASYDMCLGTRNLSVDPGEGTNDCLPNASATSLSTSLSWPAKGGSGCAVPDDPDNLDTSVYWGNMLNAGAPGTNTSAKIKDCAGARAPVVISKNKTGSGNLVFKLCVPWPWDGGGAWR